MSSEDINLVIQILSGILNPNNTIRKEAEAKLTQMNSNIGALLFCLGRVLKESSDSKIKSLAAVLIRKILDIGTNNWKSLAPELKASFKEDLLQVMVNEKDKSVKNKICDAVAKIGENIYENDETWNELLNVMYTILSKKFEPEDLSNIETALLLLTTMFGYVCDEIMKGISTLLNTFKNYFATDCLSLKAKTVQSISEMVSICDKKDTKQFREFVFCMLETTLKCAESAKDESNLKICLESIIDICESEPNLLRKSFSDIFTLMLKIAEKKDFVDESLRELALEVVVSLTERIPKLLEKDEGKLKLYLERLYQYSLETDPEISNEWCNPKTESYFDEEFIPEENVSTALSIIVRLIECLGKKFLLPFISEIVINLIKNDQDWRYKYSAFMTLAQIVEFIDDMNHIENLIPIVFENVANSNPKIRYSSIYCIDLFSESFSPHFQDKYHDKVVPILVNTVKENVLRNQLQACEALESFLEHSTDQIAGQYAQFLLDNIFQIFLVKECPVSLREQILSVITELINACGEKFKEFSEKCLKLLLNFFSESFQSQTGKGLYGTLIECITLIGPQCQEVYHTYVRDLVKTIILIQDNISNSTDFTKDYLQNAWERLAPVVKDHFQDLIPAIVESVLKLVNVDVVMSVSNKPEETFKIEEIINSIEGGSNEKTKPSNVTTSQTEDKSIAIEVLNQIMEVFGDKFLNYIEPTQNIILPLLQFKATFRVRSEAAESLPILQKILKATNDQNALTTYTKKYLADLLAATAKEQDNGTLGTMLDCISDLFENYGGKFLSSNELNQIFDNLLSFFAETEKRRRELLNKKETLEKEEDEKEGKVYDSDESEDEDDYANDLEQDIEEIEEILVSIADLVGALFKTHKEDTLGIVEKIIKNVLPEYFKKTNSSTFEIKMGIFFVDDMIEHLGQELLKAIWKDLAIVLGSYANHTTTEVRQAAVYGIGVFAKATVEGFEAYGNEFVAKLDAAINLQIEDHDEDEFGHAEDNAISALGKIILYQGQKISNLEEWIKKWVGYLPLKFDSDEGVTIHGLFLESIVASPNLFFGNDYANLTQIVKILTIIYKTKFSNDKVDEQVKVVLQQIAANGQTVEKLKASGNSLEEHLKKKLETILI